VAVEQIPRLVDLAAAAQGGLTSLRPGARRHIAVGRYGDVLSGWRGEASVCRRRLSSEVKASRLELAEGDALIDLADSEYWATLPDEPRKAVGSVLLRRQVTNGSSGLTGNFSAGTIPEGSRFRRPAAPSAQPAREEAIYASREPFYAGKDDTEAVVDLGGGEWRHEQRASIVVDAQRDGEHANTPRFIIDQGELAGEIVSELFDEEWEVVELVASGGQIEVGDAQLRRFAARSYSGRLGPINNAILAGAFSHGGVWHAVLVEDASDAVPKLYVADKSWAASPEMLAEVAQVLLGKGPESAGGARRWLGFGARVALRPVFNFHAALACEIMLRSSDYAEDTSEIGEKIRAALVSYFDDRADWYTYKRNGIGSAIASADRRILGVDPAAIVVRDRTGSVAATDLPSEIDPSSAYATHTMLVDESLEASYVTPG
jgi:hypothetical protein